MSQPAHPPVLLTRTDVARMLGIPLRQLTWWVWALDEKKRYTEFEIPKRRGEAQRVIRAPIKPIKDVQQKLARTLDDCYKPPSHVHGFVKGRSPRTSAAVHRRQEWLLRVDLADFFPSINFGRVMGMFMSYPFEYPHDVAVLLSQVCCHRNELPQGAPTSPVISNLICRGLDKELAALAKGERTFYSRYADDLCFSTDRKSFPPTLASRTAEGAAVGSALAEVIGANGFNINASKTRLVRRTQRQRVTGLVVNQKINVSRDYVRSLRNLLFIWRAHGRDAAEARFKTLNPERGWPPEKPAPDFTLVVRGRVQHVGSVKGWESPVYKRLSAALAEADASFVPRPAPTGAVFQVMLNTEGPTDINHMLAAQAYFHEGGEFQEFELVVNDNSSAGNDAKLLERCRVLAETNDRPNICLFDTDSANAQKAIGPQGLKKWSVNVFAVGLVSPDWRDSDAPLCIELLHEESVLQRHDGDGRRIYLRDEFRDQSPSHKTLDVVIPNARNRTLVQETVFDADEESVGLSKADFATMVKEATPPFDGISFEGFRGTFELLAEASAEMKRGDAAGDRR
jgi:RNA-directed DNA polymerase